MYGAVGDGINDDTAAVQEALNQGGLIYFPAGRYKVTSQLSALVPCTIKMHNAYPSSYNESIYEGYTYPMGDYPTNDTYNYFGARIETSASGIGLLVGESVVVDGLNIRAMDGFTGTVFKYDGSKGARSYPSRTRLKHISISNATSNVTPDVMFDFHPSGNYGVIVDDIIIGGNHIRQNATYGFKCILDRWANSVRLSNINVEMFSNYPFYIDGQSTFNGGTLYAANWVLTNICLQAYPIMTYDNPNYAHINMLRLGHMTGTYLSGCKIWDVEAANVSGKVVETTNLQNTTAVGNDSFVNAIDTLLLETVQKHGGLDISGLAIDVQTDDLTSANIVKMTDGNNNTKEFLIPAVALTDEQVKVSVGSWMSSNAIPTAQIGKNKLNPDDCWDGVINETWGHQQEDIYYWVTGYIPCEYGDVIRVWETVTTKATGLKEYRSQQITKVYEYDINYNFLGPIKPDNNTYTPSSNDVAYFRVRFYDDSGQHNFPIMYEDRDKCMVTINNPNDTFEPYQIKMVGGLGQYLVLAAPDGTQYTLAVDNNGVLSALKVE